MRDPQRLSPCRGVEPQAYGGRKIELLSLSLDIVHESTIEYR